jgi:hypothetical protein
MIRDIVHPDLADERTKCTFDQSEMRRFIFSPEVSSFIDEMIQLISKRPELDWESNMTFPEMTREQVFEQHWRRNHMMMHLKPDVFLKAD